RFSRPRKSGEHHQFIARHADADVFEIVDPRAADVDKASHEERNDWTVYLQSQETSREDAATPETGALFQASSPPAKPDVLMLGTLRACSSLRSSLGV
ncbi:MAG: hypothetical protein G01um1014106_182, partial [Parcubacteria group bacterium Gr01-1014_106]